MTFRIRGLEPDAFLPLFDMDDEALQARGVRRVVADAPHSAPCRVTLMDAEPGERLLLLAYEHMPTNSPFRASGPIFVREAARETWDRTGEVPDVILGRTVSARAYDAEDMMLEGEVVAGRDVGELLERWLARPEIERVHLHYAGRGCFGAEATRA